MLKLKNYFDIRWLVLAVTFTTTVITLTHIPQKFMPSQIQERGVDKFLHILAYGTITALFIISLKSSLSLFSASFLFFVISVIGIFDEVTQPLVNRQASFSDLLADITGVIVVFLLLLIVKTKFRN